MITFLEFVEKGPHNVRSGAGKIVKIKKVAIRMADGTIRRMYPGKSGSSGGGGNGS